MEKHMEQQLMNKIGTLKSKNVKLLLQQMTLKAAIDDIEQAVKSNRKKVQKTMVVEADPQVMNKQLLSLELQSHKLTKRLNETVAQNSNLKDRVNAARNERIIQSGIFKGFEKQIHTLEQAYRHLLVQRVTIRIKKQKLSREEEEISSLKEKQPQKISVIQPKQPISLKQSKQETKTPMQSTIRINPTMKRIMERKKQVQKQQDVCRQTYTNNLKLLGRLTEAYGIKNIDKIEDEIATIQYEIDQIAIQNYQLSEEILKLDVQYQGLEKLSRSIEQRRYIIQETCDIQTSTQTQEEAKLRHEIEVEKEEIHKINSYFREVAHIIGIPEDSQDLHERIQQYFINGSKFNVLTDRTQCQRQAENRQQNRINHLINKSKLIHETNCIMTRSQFKQAFKEIQTKPTVKLHR